MTRSTCDQLSNKTKLLQKNLMTTECFLGISPKMQFDFFISSSLYGITNAEVDAKNQLREWHDKAIWNSAICSTYLLQRDGQYHVFPFVMPIGHLFSTQTNRITHRWRSMPEIPTDHGPPR